MSMFLPWNYTIPKARENLYDNDILTLGSESKTKKKVKLIWLAWWKLRKVVSFQYLGLWFPLIHWIFLEPIFRFKNYFAFLKKKKRTILHESNLGTNFGPTLDTMLEYIFEIFFMPHALSSFLLADVSEVQ